MTRQARARLDQFYGPLDARLKEPLARLGLDVPEDWP
jgi:hypothetical protein